MKKILILAPYPPNKSPSQRYRFEHYLPSFEKHGLTYRYESFIDEATWNIIFKKGAYLSKTMGILKGFLKRMILLSELKKYDFIFIHREASPIGPPVFEWYLTKVIKKRVIYDFDDAIWIQETSEFNKIISFIKWSSKTKFICKYAYRICVGNNFLYDFAQQFNKNVLIIPTVVNTKEVHNINKRHKPSDQVPTIGWTGTFSTVVYLNDLLPVLQQLQNEVDFNFLVICNKDPHLQIRNYKYMEWKKASEASDLELMDIGIMPLPETEWAKGKCGFKAIQYMSLGIPAVVSNVGVNNQIVDNMENGYVCNNDLEWFAYLKELISDATKRELFGARAKQKIEKYYSVSSQEARFFSLFL